MGRLSFYTDTIRSFPGFGAAGRVSSLHLLEPVTRAAVQRILVDALASGLHALGLRRGERVGMWSPNRAEWLVTQFATARIGAILVNINPAYRLSELEYTLNKAGVGVLVSAAAFKSSDYLGMLQTLGVCAAGAGPRLPLLRYQHSR